MIRNGYEDLGVSASKPDVHAAIAGQDPGLYPGAFCKIIPDELSENPDKCLLVHADGAGTKSALAYLAWQETGNPGVFRHLAQDSIVMNTDDALCVGVTNRFVVSNVINRNAHRIDGAVIAELIEGHDLFAWEFAKYGVKMYLAGGETADVGDLVSTSVIDSTLTALVDRSKIIDASKIKAGNAVVGLASFGQATYESMPNSGIGSNGFTRARHALLHHDYAGRYPETFSSTLADSQVYQGPYHIEDKLPSSNMNVGDALLSPTRTYLPVVRKILEEHGDAVSGIIHCSGGGQTKVLRFGNGIHVVKDDLFRVPPIFRAIEEAGGIDRREMFQVFNMGHRMEVYCDPDAAEEIAASARAFSIGAKVVGRVEASPTGKNRVTVVDADGTYTYD